jgi:transposase-like protein
MIAPGEQFWMPAAKPPEFRRRAMELARRRGQPMVAIAADLGIGESYLRRWMKTDDIDADRAEGLSTDDLLVPPPAIRQLRDLTRYRVDLIEARTAGKQRVEKLIEDALIKLSVVVSDLFGVSGRAIMAALIAGEPDPAVLAGLVRGRLRAKSGSLTEALTGRFTDHHAGPSTLTADQLPAARNWSTTLCRMRPRGGTSILFALAHARTATGL